MTEHVIDLDGSRALTREEIGGKAYSVNEMRRMGLPVPPAFVLPTAECRSFHVNGGALDAERWAAVRDAVGRLEEATGRRFGRGPAPLLVSVRSGAAESMPGMMDTVLDLGLTADLADALGRESGDPAWAADTWSRFVESYRTVVGEGEPPAEPWDQLRHAIGAVFRSWDSPRAVAYRERHALTGLAGTAVTVQAMVFGNRDDASGTGVLFSRDPASGAPGLSGEWLARAQGEEVVSGVRTPEALDRFAEEHPAIHAELERATRLVENELRDLADLEFTVESGRLYVLQSRVGKRTPAAAVRIAVDLVREGLISSQEAVGRISADHAERLLESAAVTAGAIPVATGAGIGTGIAVGVAISDAAEAERRAGDGEDVVLVRRMTSPDDVPTMFVSAAVVTEVGGATSHAALVCREIGLPCVVGCGEGTIARLEGRIVTVDGSAGAIYEGDARGAGGSRDDYLRELLSYLPADLPDGHPLAALADRARLESGEVLT